MTYLHLLLSPLYLYGESPGAVSGMRPACLKFAIAR